MYSVTQRIKVIKQPRGGYVPPKNFTVTQLKSNIELNPNENIHPTLIGLVVDYLSRFMVGAPIKEAFGISLLGARKVDEEEYATELLGNITKELDFNAISSACKLVGYDVCFRVGRHAYKPVSTINPDKDTVDNIREMVNRSINFFKEYGPVTLEGFVFIGGYTDVVSTGDGDFLTKDTIWDFKVSAKAPTTAHTLQLLMYYLMGKNSINKEFETVKNLGIYNPRLNTVYSLNVSKISPEIIEQVCTDVIGYKK